MADRNKYDLGDKLEITLKEKSYFNLNSSDEYVWVVSKSQIKEAEGPFRLLGLYENLGIEKLVNKEKITGILAPTPFSNENLISINNKAHPGLLDYQKLVIDKSLIKEIKVL
jgi:hypothetical protein